MHSNNNNLSDEDLLQHYRRTEDNRWLGMLLQRYTLLLLGVGLKYLKDREHAEDAVQHIFLKALTHLPDGEIQNFKGWLYILMRNHCLQLLRDRQYNVGTDAVEAIPAATGKSKEELHHHDYTLEQMNEALAELNEEQRETIKMFYLKKMSYQQITEQTGYSYMQVKSYIQNGKRNLKQALIKKLEGRQ